MCDRTAVFVSYLCHRTKPGTWQAGGHVMVIGAGAAGQTLMREIQRSSKLNNMRVKCFIDDNKNKNGRFIEGVPVAGTRDDIFAA